ncbi:S24 family peptidase [Bacteroides sp. 519]|uniref:S24 family peptidase n=1 Tax=Bacteroides sp. 519 TaxID=2302937 RepID=UPI0013D3DF96|nr:S24 family peptidase [Bacteroides sp. 519]NDV58941.1 hypothetical protein [Bacteroides sp. 519]
MDNSGKISRLRIAFEYLKENGIANTQAEVAQKMNAADVTISRAFNGNEKYLTDKFLKRFNRGFGEIFNLNWLQRGEGDMLVPNKVYTPTPELATPNLALESNVDLIKPPKYQTDELYLETKNGMKYYAQGGGKYILRVPLVPYDAYARFEHEGSLELDRDEWEEVDFEVDVIGRGNYMAFKVRGDSMDDGTRKSFAQGEIVLVRELERIFWRDELRLKRYPYWVIAFGNSILLKQITEQDLETGDIICHSLNSSPEYRDFTVNLDEVQLLGNVIKKKTLDVDY